MADGSTGTNVVRHLVDTAWSARDAALADPDDPLVRGFAEFGLPSYSPLAAENQLRALEHGGKACGSLLRAELGHGTKPGSLHGLTVS